MCVHSKSSSTAVLVDISNHMLINELAMNMRDDTGIEEYREKEEHV